MLTPHQTNRPKIALTSMCMEVTYKCRLLGLSLFMLWPTLLTCSCRANVTATSLSILEVFELPTFFSLNYLANWYQESSQVQWRECHAWLGFGTLSLCLLYLFSSFFCFSHATHVIYSSSSRKCPLSGAIEAEHPGCWVLLQCRVDPRTSGRMDCDIIDVNSVPDESTKDNSYFHVHGSHLQVLLAWSIPSPCFGRLCSHVVVALWCLLHKLVSCKF